MADKRTFEELNSLHERNLQLIKQQVEAQAHLTAKERERLELNRRYYENERAINRLLDVQAQDREAANKKISEITEEQKKIVAQLQREEKTRKRINALLTHTNVLLRDGWKYLMESDKVIKSTILNLGMSGAKADMMRASFEQSAGYVARLGGELKDVQTIMEGYADTTGRARALSEETVKSVMAIGKGTGLGVEEATKLAAQFEFMGKDAINTMNYVQGVVETSERMGVNTTKVLKDISANFKKLSTFTFQGGTKAFAQMAIDAERTRVSMETALNVAEATRGLEAVIELGANLQVMGGEFAKMDPLHWMYTVRNEPERINQMISDMTKGLFTLRKQADGTFERFITPADRDRLANVAKSLGITNEEMFQIAQRSSELASIQRDLSRLGLSTREKQLVEGAAQFDSETGKMYVRIGRTMQDITKMTSAQAKAFASEQELLEERARQAMTFDEILKSTINELKTSLLPILNGINYVLKEWVRPVVESVMKALDKIDSPTWKAIAGGAILTGAYALKAAAVYWSKVLLGLQKTQYFGMGGAYGSRNIKSIAGRAATLPATGVGDTGGMVVHPKTGTPMEGATRARDVGMARRMQAAGGRNLRTGLGVGAAGLGVGAGIGAGAMGIAEMAKAFRDLDVEQLKQLNNTMLILGGTMAVVGTLGLIGAKGLFAVGVAALAIGAGIGIAAAGVGFMAESLGSLLEKASASSGELMPIAKGIAAIAGATMLFANPLNLLGLTTLTATMGVISAGNIAAAVAANSFEKMATAMSGTKEDFLAVERAVNAINSLDRRNTNIFSDLAKIMSQPLKVELAENGAVFRSDITLQIDKTKFLNEIVDVDFIAAKTNRRIGGKV